VEGALTAEWRQQHPPAETGAQLLQRILTERRARWEAKQLAKFQQQGKTPPKDWQKKYPEPVQPDTSGLPELPQGWVWACLDALIDDGPQNGLYLPASQYGKGMPILRIDDYQIGWHRSRSALNLVDADKKTVEMYALNVRDIVINRVNSMTHLGKSLCIAEAMAGVLFESNMMRLHLSEHLVADYVTFYLGSDLGRERLTSDAKWAVNQASINQQDVKKTPIPFPSQAEQQQIAQLLSSHHEAIERQLTAIGIALKQSTAQRQNILRAAFSGHLVPQDPADEPASVLLARIRAERQNTVIRSSKKFSAVRPYQEATC
jgi:type I restriction enzyme S subunit